MKEGKCVKNCGECPFYELFLNEFEPALGKKVGKGRCHKYNEDEVPETKAACFFAEQTLISELGKLAF